MPESAAKTWGNHTFELIGAIHPETDDAGQIRALIPQAFYRNSKGLPLNPYGHGPFCQFRIPNDKRYAGVYVLTVRGKAIYVGECSNLSSRYNNGYGHISPRNCYEGGQLTNCRVNHLVYNTAKVEQPIELWFLRTADRKTIEAALINTLQPEWNRKGNRPG